MYWSARASQRSAKATRRKRLQNSKLHVHAAKSLAPSCAAPASNGGVLGKRCRAFDDQGENDQFQSYFGTTSSAANDTFGEAANKPVVAAARSKRGGRQPCPTQIPDDMNARITRKILAVGSNKRQKLRDNKAQHYTDFCFASGLDPFIKDPTDVQQQAPFKRWMSYESEVQGIKGSSIKGKIPAIDKLHTSQGYLAPSQYADDAMNFLTELCKDDAPSQPRLPVPRMAIDIFILENDFDDYDVEVEATAMSTALDYCLRSKEYLKTEKGLDARSLHWKDCFFKAGHIAVEGKAVETANRLTCSLLSSKNGLLRCTRTTTEVAVRANAVKRMKSLYLRILKETGSPPDPDAPVFRLKNGSVLSRSQVSGHLQDILVSVGIPKHLVGSHSLRRGGASMYRAAKDSKGRRCDDEHVKRFGRWNSDAFKLYIHLESTAMDEWAEDAGHLIPRFELN